MSSHATDVYIVGTPYSGSTLLGNALNGHPDIAFAGEFSRLPPFDINGDPEQHCPLCAARGVTCPVWTDALIDRMGVVGPAGAMAEYRNVVGSKVVVDGSKHVAWLRQVFPAGVPDHHESRVKVIVSLRHPFSYFASARRRVGCAPWQAANAWRDAVYDALRTLARLGIPYLIVRHEDLALNPFPVLRRLCEFVGVEFDAGTTSFWNKPVHAIGGNAGAYVWYGAPMYFANEADRAVAMEYLPRGFGGWVDDKWRRELSEADIGAILSTPMLSELLDLVGYTQEITRQPLLTDQLGRGQCL